MNKNELVRSAKRPLGENQKENKSNKATYVAWHPYDQGPPLKTLINSGGGKNWHKFY
jgi:hypothetical protein